MLLGNIEKGSVQIVIATHSVLSDNVKFKNLSLVITDEQHRFGVEQRANLSKKQVVDQIVMSATPIPRSLALVLYGGLEVSEINDRPGGESKVKTNILTQKKVNDMWNFVYQIPYFFKNFVNKGVYYFFKLSSCNLNFF